MMSRTVTKRNSRQIAWKKRNPWNRYLEYARRRCNDDDPEGENFKDYYGRGIRCSLTKSQVIEIWARDDAGSLRKPSIDRKDSRFDYANWNVRFIEFKLNARMAWDANAKPEFT